MNRIFDLLADRRIADALANGDFDGLPGAGQPLVFDDDPLVPAETRMMNRVLKQAGFVPGSVLLRHEIAALRRELAALPEGARRDVARRRLLELVLRLDETRRD